MSDYNPNEPQNFENNQHTDAPDGAQHSEGASPNVWNVPPQSNNNGDAYRPPYYAQQAHHQEPPRQEEKAPQQYSASGGWQQPNTNGSRKEPYQWNMADYDKAHAAKPKRKNKGLMVFSVIMCSVLVVSLVSFAGVGIYSTFARAPQETEPTVNVPASNLPGITLQDKPAVNDAPSADGKLSTEQIVEKVAPSIVAITTYANTGYSGYQAEGMGSGIIMREDGYIVTNAHVVEGAQGITVTLHDGETKYEGRVVGIDTKTDLAVVKVDATGLSAADFGNSDQIKVGETVIAIGNPQSMEFAGSVTQGIVSGLNRSLTASGGNGTATTYQSLIQTDAAINPGNSGGALVNEYGQIIGINSAKVIATGAEGMGFAIPSAVAKPIVDDLINYGRVTGRVRLGITASAVDEVLGRLNGWPTGLLVQSTEADSDISKKGVIPGDIITKADGNDLDGFQALTDALEGKKPGDTVDLEVYRPSTRRNESGRFFNITVTLMEDMGDAVSTQNPQDNTQQNPGYGQYPGNDGNSGYGQNPNTDEFEDFFRDFFG